MCKSKYQKLSSSPTLSHQEYNLEQGNIINNSYS